MAEMLLTKDHHVSEAVPQDRSDQPLCESIIKSSQLHSFRLIERRPSRSLMPSRMAKVTPEVSNGDESEIKNKVKIVIDAVASDAAEILSTIAEAIPSSA
jgi:hypothetical protein